MSSRAAGGVKPPSSAAPDGGSAEIMRAIAAASLDALITIDGDGRVVEFSPAAEALFGHRRSETLQRPVAEIVIPERLREAHDAGMARYHQSGHGPVINTRVEVPAVRKDGSEFDAELTVVPLEIAGRRYFTAFVRDISERKATQAAQEEAQRQAEQASQAKSRFLATVSHELRTPLNAILGTMELISADSLNERDSQLAAMARESGQALLSMIDDIIDLASLDQGELALEPQATDLAELIAGVAGPARAAAREKGLDLELLMPDALPDQLLIDARRLQQVLRQLLENAVKFSAEGRISLRVQLSPRAGDKHDLVVEVHDQGIGMDEATRAALKKPFYRADASSTTGYSGMGIGLAIVMRLLEQMGSELQISSQPGRGSCFRFELTVQATRARTTESEAGAPAGDGAARVLVVDDGKPNRMIAEAMLRGAGFEVHAATNGTEALGMVAGGPYAAVLMDLRMPGMDGLQATREIRQLPGAAGRVPIIAMTANVSAADRKACITTGMNDFLPKPIRKDELLRCLAVWCPRPAAASAKDGS